MKIYRIKDDYIDYLRKYEPKVLENKIEKRPYLGVVYNINSYEYFVPLSSPKPKHKKMKNTKDFHKISGGTYGAINFNKIIPAYSDYLILYDINNEPDIRYRNLLQNQYSSILLIRDTIRDKAKNIYNLYCTPDEDLTSNDLKVKNRCCNFLLLEKLCDQYQQIDISTSEVASTEQK